MSNLTKARKYDQVTFKDSGGKTHTGVALEFRSDRMVVGVTDPDRPTIKVRTRKKDGTPVVTSVPRNSLWLVPYDSVIHTSVHGFVAPQA